MSEERKNARTWTGVALLIGMPMIYVLTSGQARMVARRCDTVYLPDMPPPHFVKTIVPGDWWFDVYAPVYWASEQSWGAPLNWYWDEFPDSESFHLK